ncbi:hypothetical protein AAHE18_09G060900 [Arachis hypogaea]
MHQLLLLVVSAAAVVVAVTAKGEESAICDVEKRGRVFELCYPSHKEKKKIN